MRAINQLEQKIKLELEQNKNNRNSNSLVFPGIVKASPVLCLTCQSLLRARIRVTFQKNLISTYITSTISVTLLNVDDSKRCQETVIGRLQGKGLKIWNADWVKVKVIEIVIWRTKSAFHLIWISMFWATLFCNQTKCRESTDLAGLPVLPLLVELEMGSYLSFYFLQDLLRRKKSDSRWNFSADYSAATMERKDKIFFLSFLFIISEYEGRTEWLLSVRFRFLNSPPGLIFVDVLEVWKLKSRSTA